MKYLRANVNEVQSVVAPCNMCCMAMYLSWFCLLSTLFWAFLGFSNSGHWKSLHFFLDERMASGLLHGTGSLSSWRNELGAISADIDPALCYSVTWFQNDIRWHQHIRKQFTQHPLTPDSSGQNFPPLQPTSRTSSSSSSSSPGFGERNLNSIKYCIASNSSINFISFEIIWG